MIKIFIITIIIFIISIISCNYIWHNVYYSFIGSIFICCLILFYLLNRYKNVFFIKYGLTKYDKNKVIQKINTLNNLHSKNMIFGNTYSYIDFRTSYIIPLNNVKTIPNIIFRMSSYPFDNIPNEIKNVLSHCNIINPDYIQIYLSDDDCNLFIEEYYPEYSEAYHTVIPGAFRSDIIRLLLLYKYGGVYADIGHTFIQPINMIINDSYDLVIVKDYDADYESIYIQLANIFRPTNQYTIHNAFIATNRSNILIYNMIKHVMNNVMNKYYGNNSLDITGPNALGSVYKKLINIPLKIGISDIHDLKIKILYFNVRNNNITIIDENNTDLILTKFPNYKNIMYSKIPSYGELWVMGYVYK